MSEKPALNPERGEDVFRVSTAQACRMLNCKPNELWRLVRKGLLTPPIRHSPRRCYWLQAELETLGGKLQPVQDGYFIPRAGAARWLGVCRETVSRMVANGTLPAKRKNGRLFFRPVDLSAAKKQRHNNERLNWDQTAALLGVRVIDVAQLWRRNCFPACDTRQRFRRGDVLAWLEHYKKTGSLKPAHDETSRNLKPS
jgi:hypothetical protein